MVTVIIPVYNAEPYLRRCLDSVLASTYREFELILVNDGSTDNSLEICQEYAAKDSRILLISQPNGGVSSARNRGLDICHGEWVTFVDADDMISPNFLGIIAQEEFQSQDLLLFDFAQTEAELAAAHPVPEMPQFESEDVVKLLQGLLLQRQLVENKNTNLLSPCGKAYRKSIIDRYTIRFNLDLSYGEDQVFNTEYLMKIKRYAYLSTPVYYYNTYQSSSSHRFDPDRIYKLEKTLTEIETSLAEGGFLPLLEEDFTFAAQNTLAFFLLAVTFSPLNTAPFEERRQSCLNILNINIFRQASLRRPVDKKWFFFWAKRILFFLFRKQQYVLLSLSAWLSHVLLVLMNPEKLVERRLNGWLP